MAAVVAGYEEVPAPGDSPHCRLPVVGVLPLCPSGADEERQERSSAPAGACAGRRAPPVFAGLAALALLCLRPKAPARNVLVGVQRKDSENCAAIWEQCGGSGWSGASCCKHGLRCNHLKVEYYQCVEDKQENVEVQKPTVRDPACRDAVDNDACWKAVTWIKQQGIYQNPEQWFGLKPESTFKEYQEMLHYTHNPNCAPPCAPGGCEWIFRFEGCDSLAEWYCNEEDNDGSLAFECCCVKYRNETGAVVAAKAESGGRPSLFCNSLMVPHTYEVELLRAQLVKKLGIFGCEEWAVIANVSLRITRRKSKVAIFSDVMQGSLEAAFGGEFHTALNTDIFIKYWDKILSDKRTWRNDWTVKVDPDCLFFPDRLKEMLSFAGGALAPPEPKAGRYLNNCPLGLHGPIEAMSKRALRTYRRHKKNCTEGPPHKHGQEDYYMRECFKAIGVEKVDAYNVLFEGTWACHERPSSWHPYRPPCFSPQVSFHPFKTIKSYLNCWKQASAHPPMEPLVPYGVEPGHENQRHG